MEKIDVLIFIEHVARELDLACTLSHHLEVNAGLKVEIASYCHDLEQTLSSYQPRVVVVPYCYSQDDAGMRDVRFRFRDFKVVNLALEQLFSVGNAAFKGPRDQMSQGEVLHLASGEAFAQHLMNHHVPRDGIAITGSLACGLYLPPYRRYFESVRSRLAKEHSLDNDRSTEYEHDCDRRKRDLERQSRSILG